jgi:hypothetical protein
MYIGMFFIFGGLILCIKNPNCDNLIYSLIGISFGVYILSEVKKSINSLKVIDDELENPDE